jgi:hypothetical protein
MKFVLIVCLSIISFSISAQVGRFEEPVDTIPIGGEVQENKAAQMEAQDQLTQDLIALRDSLHFIKPDETAEARMKEFDTVIKGLKNNDRSPELMKKGYVLLNETRGELKGGNNKATTK